MGRGKRFFFFSKIASPVVGPAQSPVQWVLGPLSPELKWPECEVVYLCAFRAEVYNEWSCTSLPPLYALMT